MSAGVSGRFGEQLQAGERGQLVDMLAALHEATPTAVRAPRARIGLPWRDELDAALGELARPWASGPFAEPARALLVGTAGPLRRLLETFDRLAGHVAAAPERVVTHGEPHPANVIRAGAGTMLIDWDTVGLAPPERDLWFVIGDGAAESRRYTEATGRVVDPEALAFYRLRWALDDISTVVRQLRARHRRTADTEHAWRSLEGTLALVIP